MSANATGVPHVSVLVPAYRAERTIAESIRSALDQTVAELEVIVIDDASPQPMSVALAEVDDSRLRIIRHQSNRGVSAARNIGLALARAPIVAQLDADDLWDPEHLEKLLPAFEDPSVALVYSDAVVDGHPDGVERWIGERGASGERTGVIASRAHPVDSLDALYLGNPIPAVTALMRTDAVRAAGGYPERVSIGEDYRLYIRLMRAGWGQAYVDAPTATYRWPRADRGATYDGRRVARANVALFAALLRSDPRRRTLWKSLAWALVAAVQTHFPSSLPLMRRMRAAQRATAARLGRQHASTHPDP